jgi:hypothetical protein
MGRKARGSQISGDIRGAFIRACKMLPGEDTGKGEGLSTLIKNSLEEDVRGTLQAMKGFVPKEMDIEIDASLDHEAWLGQLDVKE